MIFSLVAGALLLFAGDAKSAPNSRYIEGIAFLPISSTNEVMIYSTNLLTEIVISLAAEDLNGFIEYEGRMWTEYGVTGFSWSTRNSKLSLGETVSQAIETWLNYNIDGLVSFNPENPGDTYFKVGVSCRAFTPDDYPNLDGSSLFALDKVFRLVRSGDGYTVPIEASKGVLIYWPKWWAQFDIFIAGLDWARIETPEESLDTRDYPQCWCDYSGKLHNSNSKGVLNFPSRFVGKNVKGKVILQLESGAKQEFDLANGRPLNFKPFSLQVTRPYTNAVTIIVEATPTKQDIRLQQSADLYIWNEISSLTNLTGLCIFNIPTNNPPKFFRAFSNTAP